MPDSRELADWLCKFEWFNGLGEEQSDVGATLVVLVDPSVSIEDAKQASWWMFAATHDGTDPGAKVRFEYRERAVAL